MRASANSLLPKCTWHVTRIPTRVAQLSAIQMVCGYQLSGPVGTVLLQEVCWLWNRTREATCWKIVLMCVWKACRWCCRSEPVSSVIGATVVIEW